MLNKTHSLKTLCVSCWTAYIYMYVYIYIYSSYLFSSSSSSSSWWHLFFQIHLSSLHLSIHSFYPRPFGCLTMFFKIFLLNCYRIYSPCARTRPKQTPFKLSYFPTPANSVYRATNSVLRTWSVWCHAKHQYHRFRDLEPVEIERRKTLKFKVVPVEDAFIISFSLKGE